ncbi:MAG: hypothetical protein HOO06_13460 [Bdellovibrionaceae bacterium]|jgi:hypothetical protein|nr:hypothetical protein [Pseudobdellovibrionaceae bacterium]
MKLFVLIIILISSSISFAEYGKPDVEVLSKDVVGSGYINNISGELAFIETGRGESHDKRNLPDLLKKVSRGGYTKFVALKVRNGVYRIRYHVTITTLNVNNEKDRYNCGIVGFDPAYSLKGKINVEDISATDAGYVYESTPLLSTVCDPNDNKTVTYRNVFIKGFENYDAVFFIAIPTKKPRADGTQIINITSIEVDELSSPYAQPKVIIEFP